MVNHAELLNKVPKILLDYAGATKVFEVKPYISSLPFCQLQYLYSILDPIEVSARDSFVEQIFMELGTVAHSVAQTYLGKAGLLYGRWKCTKCSWVSEPALGVVPCATCGKPATKYVEFRMKDLNSQLRGKCDGLLIVEGILYLLEIKTKANVHIVRKLEEPDPPHYCQAATYAALMDPSKVGLSQQIAGVAFCYMPRDYPHRMKFIFKDRDDSCLSQYNKDVAQAKLRIQSGDVEEVPSICPDEKYAKKVKYCPYAGQCFRPDRATHLKRLWRDTQE